MSAETRELTCIVCPVGCRLKAEMVDGKVTSVEGNGCKRGAQYALDELCAPKRTVTSTVRVSGGFLPLVPVKSAQPVPKEKIAEVLAAICATQLTAPVKGGQVVIANVAGTGIDIVASRSMPVAEAAQA
jgi:CxxC motif-containing protein